MKRSAPFRMLFRGARSALRLLAATLAMVDERLLLRAYEAAPYRFRRYLVGHDLLPAGFPRDPHDLLMPTGRRAALPPALSIGLRRELAIRFLQTDQSVKASALAALRVGGPGTVFLDVGSNNGVTSLIPVTEGFDSVLLEPNPRAAAEARILIEANSVASVQVRIHGIAASDADGHTDFFISENYYYSSLDPEEAAHGGRVERVRCQTMPLDRFLSEVIQPPDRIVLKIDVEGFEWQVVKGATATLNRYRPPCLIEVFPNKRADGTFGFFQALDFECFGLVDPLACFPIPATEAFQAFRGSSNFLFLPREHALAAGFRSGRIPIQGWRP